MKNNQELIDLINRLNAAWGKQANKVIYRLYDLLLHDVKIDAAVDVVRREFPEVFRLDNVHAALVEAAAPSISSSAKSYLDSCTATQCA